MRNAKVILILGKRATGKTTYIKKVIEELNKHTLIVDTFDNAQYFEIPILKKPTDFFDYKQARIINNDIDRVLNYIEKNIFNTLIVFEDSTKYVNKTIQKSIKKIVVDSKQKSNDIIFIFHGFNSCPPELFKLADILVQFKTDNPDYRKSELVYYDEIKRNYELIKNSKNQYINKLTQLN